MRLIDADAVEKITWQDPSYTDPLNVLTEVMEKVRALPTIDAVPVIRCKDCKYAYSGYKKYVCTRQFNDFSILPDGYCSLAEREEE